MRFSVKDDSAARRPGAVLFLALVAITLVGPLSIHLFMPALPFVRRAFAVTADAAQLTFSLSMLAMALATLFYGSLADRLGRLPVLIGGMALFAGGAALGAVAPTLSLLIVGRVLQGLGAACGLVMARVIVRDVYGADRLGQMIAYLTAAYVVGPLFAPPLGGILADQFGWQSILIVPAGFGFLGIVIVVTVIGETGRPGIGKPIGVARSYGRLLRDPRFALFALNPAFGSGSFFAINTGAAYLMVETLGRPATEYGLYFMLGPAGYMLGNFLCGRFSGRLSAGFFIMSGSALSLFGVLLLPAMIMVFGLAPLCLFVPAGVAAIGQGLSMPHAQAAAIATEPALTGTASGVVVFLQFLFAGGLAQLVAFGADGTATPLVIVATAAAVLGLVCGVGAVFLARRDVV